MRLTDEQVMQDNKRFENRNALAELKYCGWDIPHRKSITNDEIHFYAWLCRSAVALLKDREEEIENLKQTCQSMMEGICLLKEQETMMQCIKGKCRICPHCANCDVNENGLLKEQEAVKPITEHKLFLCPVCKNTLFKEQKFCHECGKRIEWEGR